MLDIEDKKLVKECFTDWLEIQDNRKQLNAVSKETIEKVSSILEVNKPTVNKLFTFMKKRIENGEDELDTLVNLTLEIQD